MEDEGRTGRRGGTYGYGVPMKGRKYYARSQGGGTGPTGHSSGYDRDGGRYDGYENYDRESKMRGIEYPEDYSGLSVENRRTRPYHYGQGGPLMGRQGRGFDRDYRDRDYGSYDRYDRDRGYEGYDRYDRDYSDGYERGYRDGYRRSMSPSRR